VFVFLFLQELWLEAARGRVVVDSSTSCAKCHKKLGSSAFARYPNGHIVHYGCHQKTMAAQSTLLMPKGDL
jgi:cytochrome c553